MDERRIFQPVELEQQDNQGCLDTALLIMRAGYKRENLDFPEEQKLLYQSAYGLYKQSFLLARSAAFVTRFPDSELEITVDDRELAEYLGQLNHEPQIRVLQDEITPPKVMERIKKEPLIIFLDQFHLGRQFVHAPHYIVAYGEEGGIKMIDPDIGHVEELPYETLKHSIHGLQYQMLWSPVIISMGF